MIDGSKLLLSTPLYTPCRMLRSYHPAVVYHQDVLLHKRYLKHWFRHRKGAEKSSSIDTGLDFILQWVGVNPVPYPLSKTKSIGFTLPISTSPIYSGKKAEFLFILVLKSPNNYKPKPTRTFTTLNPSHLHRALQNSMPQAVFLPIKHALQHVLSQIAMKTAEILGFPSNLMWCFQGS